jgi:hypothetical protein
MSPFDEFVTIVCQAICPPLAVFCALAFLFIFPGMGLLELARYGMVDGFPKFLGFIGMGIVLESICIAALLRMLWGEEVWESLRWPMCRIVLQYLAGCTVLGALWMSGRRLLCGAKDM